MMAQIGRFGQARFSLVTLIGALAFVGAHAPPKPGWMSMSRSPIPRLRGPKRARWKCGGGPSPL